MINCRGRIYVPLRATSEILGAEVNYIAEQIICLAEKDTTFEEIKTLLQKYDDLQNIIRALSEEKLIKTKSIELNNVMEEVINQYQNETQFESKTVYLKGKMERMDVDEKLKGGI